MTPEYCSVKHDPDNGTYGDCLRACIATIMDMDAPDVPHFADDGVSGDEAMRHMRLWLSQSDEHLNTCRYCTMLTPGVTYAPFIVAYSGDIPLSDLLAMHDELNPDSLYVLFGGTGSGDHCVVCRGGKVVHNPSWGGGSLIEPLSNGTWQVLVVGRV